MLAVVLAILTLSQLKGALKMTGSGDDTALTLLISSVSQRIEKHLGTPLLSAAVTEEYDVQPRARELFLRSLPASAVTEVKNSATGEWDDVDEIDADLYRLDARIGSLVLDFNPIPGRNALRVKYTGGLAANQAGLESAYPDIVQAGIVQAAHEWRRRNEPDRTSATFAFGAGSSSDTVQSALSLTKYTRELLDPYRRVTCS